MGDEHAVEVPDLIERGQDPRVEQQAGAVRLDQHAGVAQVRESHRQTPIFFGDLVKYTLTLRE